MKVSGVAGVMGAGAQMGMQNAAKPQAGAQTQAMTQGADKVSFSFGGQGSSTTSVSARGMGGARVSFSEHGGTSYGGKG